MTGLRIGACLSLTGRFAAFGRQAASGLEAWADVTGGDPRPRIEDDASDVDRVAPALSALARDCDLLLGPYSTQLMRTAGEAVAAGADGLLFNHGGAGDDVQTACPGRIVSVLTPTSRYAAPFVAHRAPAGVPLVVVRGPGQFARQVAAGAVAQARRLGVAATEVDASVGVAAIDELGAASERWDLFSAGRFEDDVALVVRARAAPAPPETICSIAAGVRDFAAAVGAPEGIYGIVQWAPRDAPVAVGPDESSFIGAYRRLTGARPDYPAVQAAAAATLAVECARIAGSTRARELWAAATGLRTTTLLGEFGIDARTGAQTRHRPGLVRWRGEEPAPIR
ncbi:MAG: ABC transporter substrate-binding protein [Solirubrobacterales bacterium]|nr:ABC transporter substrate-binding protein [Solirubrobacterales bacterium]